MLTEMGECNRIPFGRMSNARINHNHDVRHEFMQYDIEAEETYVSIIVLWHV